MKGTMRGAMFALAMTAAGAMAAAGAAKAEILTFDDIPAMQFQANWNGYGLPNTHFFNPPGYGGFRWSENFSALRGTGLHTRQAGLPAGSGYENALASGDFLAFNGGGAPVSFEAAGAKNFNLVSAFMGAAWYDGLQVIVKGFLDGVEVYSLNTGALDYEGDTITFNWTNIDKVTFESLETGTPIDEMSSYNYAFTLDNLNVSYIPEPATAALLLAAVAGLGAARRRKAA